MNRQLHSVAARHEASVTSLRNELLSSQSQLSKVEVQVAQLRHEKTMLQSSEARLLAEREVLHREKSSSGRIVANLQQIQLNMERGEEEGKARLQALNDNLQKEVDLLRKRLEAEQDQFRESVRVWEATNRELREKVDGAVAGEKAAMEQMKTVTATMDTLQAELKGTSEQLQMAESRLAGRGQGPTARQASVSEYSGAGSGRLRDVELLLAQTRQELKGVKDQLAEARHQSEEFKNIAEVAEKRMVETGSAMEDFKKQMEVKVEQAKREGAEKVAGQLTAEKDELEEKMKKLESDIGESD